MSEINFDWDRARRLLSAPARMAYDESIALAKAAYDASVANAASVAITEIAWKVFERARAVAWCAAIDIAFAPRSSGGGPGETGEPSGVFAHVVVS
jgi:hypothetical protein